jgi:hypothetical protein
MNESLICKRDFVLAAVALHKENIGQSTDKPDGDYTLNLVTSSCPFDCPRYNPTAKQIVRGGEIRDVIFNDPKSACRRMTKPL